MDEFKQRFIDTAYSKFGIKAIESINFEQAFAILDEMQQCNIANVVGQSEQLCGGLHSTDWNGKCFKCGEQVFVREPKRALPINGVSKFDMQKFKEYVNTYDAKKNGLDNDDTIVKDMLYGIGLCLNKKEFEFADGFKKFKTFIKAFL